MIVKITGELIECEVDYIVINTNGGIAYCIDIPANSINADLMNTTLTIHTHMVVREDAHLLFGFAACELRNLFRILIKVSGIGPRIALALISHLSMNDIYFAIKEANIKLLCTVSGIGNKMAERMILELKDKLQDFDILMLSHHKNDVNLVKNSNTQDILHREYLIKNDIKQALVSLGYSDKIINVAIKQLTLVTDVQTGIKMALKIITTKSL